MHQDAQHLQTPLVRLGRIKLCNVNVRDKLRSPKIPVTETWNLFVQQQSSRTNVSYRGTQVLNLALRHAHCNTHHAGPCVPASTLATFAMSYCPFTWFPMLYFLTAPPAVSQTIMLSEDVRAGGQIRISAFSALTTPTRLPDQSHTDLDNVYMSAG